MGEKPNTPRKASLYYSKENYIQRSTSLPDVNYYSNTFTDQPYIEMLSETSNEFTHVNSCSIEQHFVITHCSSSSAIA